MSTVSEEEIIHDNPSIFEQWMTGCDIGLGEHNETIHTFLQHLGLESPAGTIIYFH